MGRLLQARVLMPAMLLLKILDRADALQKAGQYLARRQMPHNINRLGGRRGSSRPSNAHVDNDAIGS
jgi:hypothetical protein